MNSTPILIKAGMTAAERGVALLEADSMAFKTYAMRLAKPGMPVARIADHFDISRQELYRKESVISAFGFTPPRRTNKGPKPASDPTRKKRAYHRGAEADTAPAAVKPTAHGRFPGVPARLPLTGSVPASAIAVPPHNLRAEAHLNPGAFAADPAQSGAPGDYDANPDGLAGD